MPKKVMSGAQAIAEAVKRCKPGVIAVYPITPQTPISEGIAQMVADGDIDAELIMVESEHSAMSACMGASATGVRAYTATASQGLCVTPDTEIIMENPGVENIKKFVDENLKDYKINHGKWEIGSGKGRVLAWNGQEFEYDEITHVQRIESPKKLIKITTKSGSEVKVTPDHKILIDSLNGAEWVEAKKLKGNEYLYAPRKIKIKNAKRPKIIDLLPENVTVTLDSEIKDKLVKKIKSRYGSLNKGSKKLGIPKHHILSNFSISLKTIKKLCNAGIIEWKEVREKTNTFSVHGSTIKIPFKKVNEDLMYLLGLMSSDGYFGGGTKTKNRFVFTNKNKKLLELFPTIYKRLFPAKPVGKVLLKTGVIQLMGSNFIFLMLAEKTDLKEIFNYEESLIKAFLRGYFDGDGSCRIQKKNRIQIVIHCRDKIKVSGLRKLLLRTGIVSHVYKKNNTVKFIYICGLNDTMKFINNIGSNHPMKQQRFTKAKEILSKSKHRPQWSGKAPLMCRNLLRRAIIKEHSLREIDPENYIHKTKSRNTRLGKVKMREIIKRIEEMGYEKDKDVELLKKMASDSFFLDPIKKIEEIESPYEYVYDISVKKNRSFVPNAAFVVSNCLMHEMLFAASGMRLPVVMSVANRALNSPLNIWNDQQDSFAQRDSGWVQLYVENAQEAFDTQIQAFKIAEEVRLPVMVCLDGYVITHTYEPMELIEQEVVDKFLPKFKPVDTLNPSKPLTLGAVGGPEHYILFRKQQQEAMEKAAEAIQKANIEYSSAVGRKYGNGLIEIVNLEGKDSALITIGSVAGTVRPLLDKENMGMIRIRTLRPFPVEDIRKACANLKSIGVLEKDISIGANGALYDEVKAALYDTDNQPKVSGFIAGLGGRDITEKDIELVLKKIKSEKEGVEWVF